MTCVGAISRSAIMACWGLSVLAGCARGPADRLPFAGRVTFAGAPLDGGVIELVSADGARQSGGRISKGEFSVPATRGLPAGTHVVRITAVEETAAAPAGPPGPEAAKHVAKERIPADYNLKTGLTAEIRTAGPNRFDFDLEEKKK